MAEAIKSAAPSLPTKPNSCRKIRVLRCKAAIWNRLPDIYDPAFRDALLKLSKVKSARRSTPPSGWHLIQLLDTRQVDKTDAAQKDRAYRMLFNP